MSNRTLIEFNHDMAPPIGEPHDELLRWATKLALYLYSGKPADLPAGATFVNIRHHTDPCPVRGPV